MKGTVFELVLDTTKNTYRTLLLQNNWGTAVKPVLPYKSMGACDLLIATFWPRQTAFAYEQKAQCHGQLLFNRRGHKA